MKTHTEDTFEDLIVEPLMRHRGYEPVDGSADPDAALATHIDTGDLRRGAGRAAAFSFSR